MVRSFYIHLTSVLFVHALIMFGTWQMSQSKLVPQEEVAKLGNGPIQLQMGSVMKMGAAVTKPAPVQKKTVRAPVQTPVKTSTTAVSAKAEASSLPTGQSGNAVMGTSQGSEFGTAMSGKTDALSVYKAELRAMIDKNKSYPAMSKRLGQTGTVVIGFTLLKDGNIVDVRIEKPSQYDRLNDSALEAVKKVERFKPLPQEVADGKMEITVPVKFVTI